MSFEKKMNSLSDTWSFLIGKPDLGMKGLYFPCFSSHVFMIALTFFPYSMLILTASDFFFKIFYFLSSLYFLFIYLPIFFFVMCSDILPVCVSM